MNKRTPRPASWERTVSVAVLLLAIRRNGWKITPDLSGAALPRPSDQRERLERLVRFG